MTKAIRIPTNGGPEVMKWEDVPTPEPGPGEALLRHHAVGLNYIDVYFRTGLYRAPSMPLIIGQEGARHHHHAIRQGGDLPVWKYYYESRNMLYYHWHIMHRTGRYPRNFARLIGRAAVRQKQAKFRSLLAIGQGTVDGAFGRLGIRFPIVPLQERQLTAGDDGSRS